MSNQTVTTTSKRFTLNLSDWWKGLIMAVVAPIIQIILASIDAGTLTFNWSAILKTALAAGLAYILKNLFDAPRIVVSNPTMESIDRVKSGEAEVKVMPT